MSLLSKLQQGEKAIIDTFAVEDIPLKLIEMGCIPGSLVEIVQFAPYNDPIHIDINGTHLAIRANIASKIKVKRFIND